MGFPIKDREKWEYEEPSFFLLNAQQILQQEIRERDRLAFERRLRRLPTEEENKEDYLVVVTVVTRQSVFQTSMLLTTLENSFSDYYVTQNGNFILFRDVNIRYTTQ